MPRRSSRPRLLPDDPPLEGGWQRHDGGPCPLAPEDRPALLFRSGSRFRAGTRPAGHWDGFADGSCWQWSGREPDAFDILAWRPERAGDEAAMRAASKRATI